MTLMTLMMWVIIGMAVGSGLLLAVSLCVMAARGDRAEERACLRKRRHAWDRDEEDEEDIPEYRNPRL